MLPNSIHWQTACMIPESSESLFVALSLFSVVEMDNMKEPLLKLKAMLYKEKPKQKLEHKNLRRFHVHILHLIMLGGSIIWYLLTASLFSITDSPQPLGGGPAWLRLSHRPPGAPRPSACGKTRPRGVRSSRSQTRWSSHKTTFPFHSRRGGEPQMWA